ncbi:MAG: DNA repair protein RecO [Candidatus Wildermuthbacteria bacterium GWA2_46_15]|uniref:DNA repair protein RecO n=1 Tax=Candidatus Wildermuthbacteria bacterium GWA2_46_15 TaxID=1802443 RepID=A0A1G2QMK0_9BACT|nr:MAG: DNA repair protein RecO [Candidatus Wildermuthbacteria bacterium GWA2_46_15]
MFSKYRTKAFILRSENRGESDQLFWIYTKDFGQITVSAKGIRKLNSKLRGSIQIFYLSGVEFVQGRVYKTLTDAVLIEKFPDLRKNFLKLRLAYRFTKIFCSLVKNQQADEDLWQLLYRFFSELNRSELSLERALFFYYFFFWDFLNVLGYHPELYQCVFCRRKIAFSQTFWKPQDGGLVCPNCFEKAAVKPQKVNAQTIKVLRLFLTQEWKTVRLLKTDPVVFQELKVVSRKYFHFIHEKR